MVKIGFEMHTGYDLLFLDIISQNERGSERIMRFFEYPAIFAGGGVLYGLIELLFRGRTHWTMLIAGGVCSCILYTISTKSSEREWKKWIMGGASITAVEFVTGGIVNLHLGWNVWDYSHLPVNLMGQICLLFSVLWVLLCIPAMWLCRACHHAIHGKVRP